MMKPQPDYLNSVLNYFPETGKLFWKKRPPEMFRDGGLGQKASCKAWNTRYSETEAFNTISTGGYLQGQLNGTHFAHQIIWAMVFGYYPKEIDHINGIRTDNRLVNLRDVSRQQNCCNRKKRSDNSSGHTGVRLIGEKWEARIHASGKEFNLGRFSTKEEAITAWRKPADMNGYHKNHGRVV